MFKLFVMAFSLFLGFLFVLKDILILIFSPWPHLYRVVNTPALSFEEVYCYLPLAHNSPDAVSFFPTITLGVQRIILNYLCAGNLDIYILLMHGSFPLASFWILAKFYRRYVSWSWSILLAFFGVTFFNNFSSFKYILFILFNPSTFLSSASLTPLEITRCPIPSFTFFIFILCFYLCTQTYKISLRRSVMLSCLWALNLYVYLYNFIAGSLFWMVYLICAYRLQRKFFKTPLAKLLAINLLTMIVVSAPYFLAISGSLLLQAGKDVLPNLGLALHPTGFLLNDWGPLLSYLLPMTLTVILIRLYCADYYELFYKFTPVFILIAVELVILNSHLFLGYSLQNHLFSIRIGNFFCRYLYYLPIIYFFSHPFKPLFHTRNDGALAVFQFFNKWVIPNRRLITVLGILGISGVVITSSFKGSVWFDKGYLMRMQQVEQSAGLIKRELLPGERALSEDIAVNLLLSLKSPQASLFLNSFNSSVLSEEIIDRFVLYAKIFNWSKAQFLTFMLPAQNWQNYDKDNNALISDIDLKEGFGYWSVWHRRKMSADELNGYQSILEKKYRQGNLLEGLKRFKIGVIQAIHPPNTNVPIAQEKKASEGKIYEVR